MYKDDSVIGTVSKFWTLFSETVKPVKHGQYQPQLYAHSSVKTILFKNKPDTNTLTTANRIRSF